MTKTVQPGTRAFRGIISALMSMSALAIDLMLPAFTEIRKDFHLPPTATSVGKMITIFLLGMAAGQIPAGLFTDRFGRKPLLYLGLAITVVAAGASAIAPTVTTMLIARFVWGLGSACLRVGTTATVRDAFDGERMAREMSFVMAVFVLVPVFAPTLGAGMIKVIPWRGLFWFCAAVALAVMLLVRMLPETLEVEKQRALKGSVVIDAARSVWHSRETTLLLIATTALFAAFSGYLSTSSTVVENVFNLKKYFPIFFALIAAAIGIGMLGNSRLVMKFGLRHVVSAGLIVYTAGAALLVLIAAITHGRPSATVYLPLLAITIAAHGTLMPNTNAAALRPMGAMAGTASAVIGTISTGLGSVLGGFINDAVTTTVWPVALGFLACGIVAAITAIPGMRIADSAQQSDLPMPAEDAKLVAAR
jgi:MFS transporter, DHA1 family, multidrug resistance protein